MGDEADANQPVALGLNTPFRFAPPKTFKGKEDEFELFSYKLKAFLNMADPGYRASMNLAAQETDEINFETLARDRQRMSIHLQNVLISLTEGPALRIVKRQEQSENGFEAWRQLCLRYVLQEFESNFNDFEAEIEKYDRDQNSPFPDEVKIGVLLSRTSGPLHEHLLLNTDLSTPWNQIRTTVINYFQTNKTYKNLRNSQSSFGSTNGPTPMEIDAIWRRLKGKSKGKGKDKGKSKSKGKDDGGHFGSKGKSKSKDKGKGKDKGKSKGKGKGKSKFAYPTSSSSSSSSPLICSHCGKQGHSADTCWSRISALISELANWEESNEWDSEWDFTWDEQTWNVSSVYDDSTWWSTDDSWEWSAWDSSTDWHEEAHDSSHFGSSGHAASASISPAQAAAASAAAAAASTPPGLHISSVVPTSTSGSSSASTQRQKQFI
jgi:hypothetical protein